MPDKPPRWRSRQEFFQDMGKGNRWRGGLPLKHRASIFPNDFERLHRLRADVLVTHEAPTSHRHGFLAIDELAREMGVKKIFHRHHHQDYNAKIDGGIEVRGVGLANVVDLDGRQMVETIQDKRQSSKNRMTFSAFKVS
ncbi:metallophosphoesterase family protein [Methylohalobius crimeensis]|uniref:metallophosphoesterase family protein n=1 Tax=Methylohalobius crimeensis TaxID=244365 RepID=UPI001268F173|nr:hypothetical protein [Methylohalobius crimeensis]